MLDKPARTLRLSAEDNVVVATEKAEPGATVAPGVAARQRIPFGHKVAVVPIGQGQPVRKFGQIIGFASKPIEPGDWVHEHNCDMGPEHGAFERDYQIAQGARPENILPVEEQATFQGFRRANGKAGTRNYVGILTSVNCSTTVAGFIAKEIERSGILDDYPNIDGIVALKQANGCVIDYRGVIFDTLKKTTWGYATNPNMGGVVMVGLGCEGFQIPRF
jgi:altronate hydrolase